MTPLLVAEESALELSTLVPRDLLDGPTAMGLDVQVLSEKAWRSDQHRG